jgi:RNA polymerase sigma-70 factor (ECF subfamily)
MKAGNFVSICHETTERGAVDSQTEWFTGLYDQYYRNVLRYTLQHADQRYAEDVASETFLIAWRRAADVPAEAELPWLLGVARNLLRKQTAAARKQQRIANRIQAMFRPDDHLITDAAERAIERSAALGALAALPESDVETLALVTWHGLTPAEAATVVGCSPRTFAVRLHRARKKLTARLADHEALPASQY